MVILIGLCTLNRKLYAGILHILSIMSIVWRPFGHTNDVQISMNALRNALLRPMSWFDALCFPTTPNVLLCKIYNHQRHTLLHLYIKYSHFCLLATEIHTIQYKYYLSELLNNIKWSTRLLIFHESIPNGGL